MGKAKRLRKQRREAEQASQVGYAFKTSLVNHKDIRDMYAYWITGYIQLSDKNWHVIEPFCAVRQFGKWNITNLSKSDVDWHLAERLLESDASHRFVFEDRYTAMCYSESLANEKTLLDSFQTYMSNEDMTRYLEEKGEK